MYSSLASTLLLGSFAFASAQIAPGPPQTTPQPGAPQQQPGAEPTAPNAIPGAPPTFVPGVGAGNDQPAAAHRVIRISGGVITKNILSRVDPVYPKDARDAHIGGVVVMNALIGKDGRVQNLAVVSGPQALQAAAIDAVRQWVYRPYVFNGQAVDVMTTITVNFNLR